MLDEYGCLPPHIASLDEVELVYQGGYQPAEGGGFRLHESLVEHMDRHRARIAEQREVAKNRFIALLARIGIREALTAAGVTPEVAEAAAALMRERLRFQLVEPADGGDDYTVEVDGEFGTITVADAVSAWLAGDAGGAYRPKPKPGDGPWSEAMRRLH